MKALLLASLVHLLSGSVLADETFMVNPASNCGQTPYFGGPTYFLEAGLNPIRWESGGHSYWSSDAQSGGTAWRATIQGYVHATGDMLSWSTGLQYPSLAAASADASGEVFDFELPVASLVTFFIFDTPCGDNRGSITLTLLDDPTAGARELPLAFALQAPVPNPFNPSTTLGFTLPETGSVSLAVYDVKGRLVSRLLDGMLSRGEHEVVFEAGNQPSGLYIARLQTERGQSTQKLMLVK